MEKKCCICGKEFNGFGNNAEPIAKGTCCDDCDVKYVITSRLLDPKECKNVSFSNATVGDLRAKNFVISHVGRIFVGWENEESGEIVMTPNLDWDGTIN